MRAMRQKDAKTLNTHTDEIARLKAQLIKVEDAQCALKKENKKLRALNVHLTTKCAVNSQEIAKLQDAYGVVVSACNHLDKKTAAYTSVFQEASTDKELQKKLLEIVDKLKINSF